MKMNKNNKDSEDLVKQVIEDTLSEVFAIDGRLRQIHEVHLRPYDVTRIKQSVRKALKDEYDLDYPKQAIEMESKKEFMTRVVKSVKENTVS